MTLSQPSLDNITQAFSLVGLLSGFIAGLLTSLTPCVYPLIPITLAVLGTREASSRTSAFIASFVYVLGIAATYTILGIVAAQTGSVFGSFLGSFWVQLFVVLFLGLLVLYSLELFSLDFLSRLQTVASRIGGKGLGGAFVMGAVSGVVAAPCVGPVLALILGVAASGKNLAWGAVLLFTYAFGLGIPFIILGTFSGLIRRLPKSGGWLSGVKFIISVALCIFLFSNLAHLASKISILPEFLHSSFALWILLALSIPIARASYSDYRPIARISAAIMMSFALWNLPINSQSGESYVWLSSIDEGLAKGAADHKVVMVDFFADWCAACKEFNAVTFPDAKVHQTLEKFVLVHIDYTEISDKNTELSSRYDVAGLPCILFLDASGKEIPESRITGFLSPKDFIKHIQNLG